MIKRKDYKYWNKMTWGWYAVPYILEANHGKKRDDNKNATLKFCKTCKEIYTVDTNKGSSNKFTQYNYGQLVKVGLKREKCYVCKGIPTKIKEY